MLCKPIETIPVTDKNIIHREVIFYDYYLHVHVDLYDDN